MKRTALGIVMMSLLGLSPVLQAAYPDEHYPEDIREQGYPNTVSLPKPVPPLTQSEQLAKAVPKPEPVVITESKRLLPLLICEQTIAKEDRHLVKSCQMDADKIYLTTQKGIELFSAQDSRDENLYLGKHGKAHEIKNVLADDQITLVLTTLKNKRYTMELIANSKH